MQNRERWLCVRYKLFNPYFVRNRRVYRIFDNLRDRRVQVRFDWVLRCTKLTDVFLIALVGNLLQFLERLKLRHTLRILKRIRRPGSIRVAL